eukprot:6865594-Prymnesium_polylepis.1
MRSDPAERLQGGESGREACMRSDPAERLGFKGGSQGGRRACVQTHQSGWASSNVPLASSASEWPT